MGTTHQRGRHTPPPTHPIDERAAAIRGSDTPRQDFAAALDDINGEWQMGGLVTPAITVLDWVRTLAFACDERERELGLKLRRVPVAPPWKEL